MPKKLLKADYIEIIESHFSKQGKRLTNLSKATLPKLKEIIEKYNIEFDEKEIIEKNDEKKQLEKEKKIQEEKEDEERVKKYKEEKERKKNEWEGLTEEEKDKVLTFIVIEANKNYLNNYWKNKKNNERLEREVDILEKKFKDEGKIVERIKGNQLCINGVNLIHGISYVEPFDWDYTYQDAKNNIGGFEPLKILEEIQKLRN
jgi:hypothetical protein